MEALWKDENIEKDDIFFLGRPFFFEVFRMMVVSIEGGQDVS